MLTRSTMVSMPTKCGFHCPARGSSDAVCHQCSQVSSTSLQLWESGRGSTGAPCREYACWLWFLGCLEGTHFPGRQLSEAVTSSSLVGHVQFVGFRNFVWIRPRLIGSFAFWHKCYIIC